MKTEEINKDNIGLYASLRFEQQDTYPFPYQEIYPVTVARIVTEGSESVNCPTDYFGTSILAVASLAIGGKVFVKIKNDWLEPALIMAAICGSSSSRKTPAMKISLEPLTKIQKGFIKLHKEWTKESGEVEPRIRLLFITDSTYEALFENLQNNPEGILQWRDEIASIWKSMNQYKAKGDDMEKFLSLWSCTMIIIVRKGKKTIIDSPYAPLLGGIQEDLLKDLLAMPENGFRPRILISYPDPLQYKYSMVEIAEESKLKYCDLIAAIVNGQKEEVTTLEFTPEAKELWHAWDRFYNLEINNSPYSDSLKSTFGKLQAYTARFALLLEFLYCAEKGVQPTAITEDSVKRGIILTKYFAQHAYKIHYTGQLLELRKKMKQCFAWLVRKGGKATLRHMLANGCANFKKMEDLKPVIDELIERKIFFKQGIPDNNGKIEEGVQMSEKLFKGKELPNFN